LTFARRQSLRLESIDVATLLSSVYHLLNSGIGGAVSLVLDIDRDVWPVRADANELETALFNLGINARDAMPDGGTVTVSVKNTTMGGVDFVAISVNDTGTGIPDDVVNKVFDPFFTTKPIGKGTGLGLSQVYGFVHQAGGAVDLKTKLGEGTTVTLYLPRSKGAMEQEDAAVDVAVGTVLLVEDNPDVAQASTDLLEQLGYEVKWAQDADTALRQMECDGIDLVFSDVVMPGKMDGIGLAKAIRAMNPQIPVLLTTGYSSTAFRNSSGFPILRKPFQLHELGRELAKLSKAAAAVHGVVQPHPG
jgi:CheY-like chemotaxis protein